MGRGGKVEREGRGRGERERGFAPPGKIS